MGTGSSEELGLLRCYETRCVGVINWRIRAAVQFHDVLHGFRASQVTGTTSLEAKFLQKLMAMR